jgi:protease I
MHRVLIFVHDLYEEMELWYPKYRLEEEGIRVDFAGPQKQMIYHGKHGYPCLCSHQFDEIEIDHYSGLIIPGGFAPDKLRRDPKVLQITSRLHAKGKCIAFICHGGWVPISAGILKGKKVTGSSAIKDDLTNAGAIFENAAVVTDGNLISSRSPDDLPQFGKKIAEMIQNL